MEAEPDVQQGREATLAGPVTKDRARVAATLADGASPADETLADGALPGEPTVAIAGTMVEGPGPTPRQKPAVPGYEILGELGRGGMGVVYLARESLLNRTCALKMVLAGDHAAPEVVVRFLAEAEAVARLQHPNVVQIHHFGTAGGLPFFELEYCAGGSLDKVLDGIPRPARAAATLVEGLAQGVAEAHRLGLVHRDLKPANVLLGDDGTPKVTDFGLVKIIGSDPCLTQTNSIVGSPSYMAPEQARGLLREIGPRSDVYSLGAIFYELLTGRPPFRAATILETLQQVKWDEPVAPSRLVPGLPRDIETIVLKCLEKEPSRRYSGARALADDLRRASDGEPILARPSLPWERAAKWARRRPALAAMIAAVQVLLLALLATVAWSYSSVRDALAVADERRLVAERAGAKESAARSEAEASRNAALAETARALLSETRALRLSHEAGWRGEAFKNLGRLATMETPTRDLVRLRTEAVACIGEPDARPLMRVESGDFGAWSLEFQPDGKALAINDQFQAVVHLWDVEANRPIRDIPKATGFSPFAFRPGGSCLALGVSGNRVVFEPIAARAKAPPPLAGPGPAVALAFDRPGSRLAVAWGIILSAQGAPSYIEGIVVYDMATGTALRTIGGPFDVLNYKAPLALAPDGAAVAAVGLDHEVRIWKVAGDDAPVTLGRHLAQVEAMAFAPDGASLATCSRTPDPVVKVWDVAARRERLALHGHTSNVWGVAFSPDGATLASAGNDMTLRFWDPRDGRQRLVATIDTGAACLAMAFAPEGRRVAVGAARVRVFELEGFDTRRMLAGHDNNVNDLVFRPGSSELASASFDNSVIVWEPKAGSRRMLFPTSGFYPLKLAYGPDGTWLAIGPAGADPKSSTFSLRTIDAETGRQRSPLAGPAAASLAVAIDPSGRWLAAGIEDGTAIVWDVATRAILRRVSLVRPVRSVAFLPASGGKAPTLFAAADGGRTALVELAGGEPREATIPGNPDLFAVAPGGDRLVASSPDGSIHLLRLPDLATLAAEARAHAEAVRALAFHPDGRLLASAGSDRRVVVRDAASLRPLFEIAAPMARVNALAFSPDGANLAFSGSSEEIAVWDFAQIRSRLANLGLGWDAAPVSDPPARPSARTPSPALTPPPQLSGVIAPAAASRIDAPAAEGASAPAWRWMRLAPEDHNAWVGAASLLAWVGDRDGYDRHRHQMLAKYGATNDPTIAERTAKACLLLPGSDAVVEQAARLAELSLARADQVPSFTNYFRMADALAKYRLGQFEAAERQSRVAIEAGEHPKGWNMTAPAQYIRAMALSRLGRTAPARAAFARGFAIQAAIGMPAPVDDNPVAAHDQRICEVLHREADLLLLDAKFPADPFAR